MVITQNGNWGQNEFDGKSAEIGSISNSPCAQAGGLKHLMGAARGAGAMPVGMVHSTLSATGGSQIRQPGRRGHSPPPAGAKRGERKDRRWQGLRKPKSQAVKLPNSSGTLAFVTFPRGCRTKELRRSMCFHLYRGGWRGSGRSPRPGRTAPRRRTTRQPPDCRTAPSLKRVCSSGRLGAPGNRCRCPP